ncbi:hypothetical protein BDW02DRAFT_565473 [Decorospora gaudefroyi]|uniref:Uncharacterized protein n=1 Tax=Decorospora gaudefroyi TaxID=184978 RepID=A0A6A5KI10_9PLEO|nr:hypothetical protein BDW02DRAFT_565473 [Decorospora gaudefroyi]
MIKDGRPGALLFGCLIFSAGLGVLCPPSERLLEDVFTFAVSIMFGTALVCV